MESHRCKLCFRNFANGKALGGHMRSHVTASDNHDYDYVFQSVSSSSSSEQDSKRVRKSSVFYSDRELFGVKKPKYDNDQSPPPPSAAAEQEPLSSSVVSDTTNEDEDVANCLMMLSRDKWGNKKEDYSVIKVVKKSSFKVRGGKYRCETCGRLFRSYQALGGHRASHKKTRVSVAAAPPHAAAEVVVEEKVHECPFCDRVFSSGQALGGHKRIHFIGAAATAALSSATNVINKPFSRIGESFGIDLNLPAPSDDDEI